MRLRLNLKTDRQTTKTLLTDGQMEIINLIGGLVTRNPPKNIRHMHTNNYGSVSNIAQNQLSIIKGSHILYVQYFHQLTCKIWSRFKHCSKSLI